MKIKITLATLAVGACMAMPSFASTLVLGLNGSASVGLDYVNFGMYPNGAPYTPAPGGGTFQVSAPVTDIFSANGVVSGEMGTITSLAASIEGLGTPVVPPVDFINFSTTGSNLHLYLTELIPGTFTAPGIPASPFTLTQTPTALGDSTTASFAVNGYILNSNDNSQTPYTGIFSATFAGYSIAQLTSSLPVNTPFSGTFALTTVPEPASLLLVGAGLLGAGLIARRRAKS